MNAILPILAALLQASSFTLDKIILKIRGVTSQNYVVASFPLIFFITLVIFLIFRPPLNSHLFTDNRWLFIIISVGLSIAGNIIFYRALKHDHLQEIQTFDLLQTFPVIILASIIFSDERNYAILIPAIIASSAVIWSHWSHHRFKIAKYTLPFFIWSLASAPVAATLSKILLQTWNPISLELIRTGLIAAGLTFFSKWHPQKLFPNSGFHLVLLTNVLTSIAYLLFYFSYQRLGIVYTILLFSLQPLLVYLGSLVFLKESFQWKKFAGFIIVLISIIAAQILQ